MHKKNGIFAMIMALVLTVGLMPIHALAEEGMPSGDGKSNQTEVSGDQGTGNSSGNGTDTADNTDDDSILLPNSGTNGSAVFIGNGTGTAPFTNTTGTAPFTNTTGTGSFTNTSITGGGAYDTDTTGGGSTYGTDNDTNTSGGSIFDPNIAGGGSIYDTDITGGGSTYGNGTIMNGGGIISGDSNSNIFNISDDFEDDTNYGNGTSINGGDSTSGNSNSTIPNSPDDFEDDMNSTDDEINTSSEPEPNSTDDSDQLSSIKVTRMVLGSTEIRADIGDTIRLDVQVFFNDTAVGGYKSNVQLLKDGASVGGFDAFERTFPASSLGLGEHKLTVRWPQIDNFAECSAELTVIVVKEGATHNVIYNSSDGGDVFVNANGGVPGLQVQVTLAVWEGYTLESISAVTESGQKVSLTSAGEDPTGCPIYSFTMPDENVLLTVKFAQESQDPPVPPTPVTYAVTTSGELSWTEGSSDPVIMTVKRSEADEECYPRFTGVELDGTALVRDEDYTADRGSTVITFSPATLQRLSKGKHTVTVNFDDGKVSVDLMVKAAQGPDVPPKPDPVDPEPKPVTPDPAPEPTYTEPDQPAEEPEVQEKAATEPVLKVADTGEVAPEPAPAVTSGAVATGDASHPALWSSLMLLALAVVALMVRQLRKGAIRQ